MFYSTRSQYYFLPINKQFSRKKIHAEANTDTFNFQQLSPDPRDEHVVEFQQPRLFTRPFSSIHLERVSSFCVIIEPRRGESRVGTNVLIDANCRGNEGKRETVARSRGVEGSKRRNVHEATLTFSTTVIGNDTVLPRGKDTNRSPDTTTRPCLCKIIRIQLPVMQQFPIGDDYSRFRNGSSNV